MDNETRAKNMGFADVEEMLLYKDVCAGRDVRPPESLEELLDNLQNEVSEDDYTKQDYDYFIRNNGLLDLFNKVKGMPLFNRMVEIFIYNANGMSLAKEMEKICAKKIEEARELFDGEQEEKLKDQFNKIRRSRIEYRHAVDYITTQVVRRMPNEYKKFYATVEDVSDTAFRIDDNGYHKPSL